MTLPIARAFVFLGCDGFHLLTECGLAHEIILFLGTQVVEMLLMALVNHRACSLKPNPHLLSQVFSHRTSLAVFLMQFLQLMESTDDIRLLSQFFSSLAQMGLYLKILLEIIFASLNVELEHIVELLYIQLIVAPQFVGL